MTLPEKRDRLLAELAAIRGAQEKLGWLVEFGRRLPGLGPEHRTDRFLVPGCLAKLWLVRRLEEGRCAFGCDSDSLIVKGIAGLLCDFYTGHTPGEILTMDPAFLAPVGITQHLTPNRQASLSRVWETIRDFAAENQAVASSLP